MLKIIGIIGLILLFTICVPTYDKWSYKAWYKRCKDKAENIK